MRISIGILPTETDADIILHPVKYKDSITYEPSSEEAVVALIAKYFTYDLVDENVKNFFDELDEGYLYSESNFDEFDLEEIKNRIEEKNEIIVGKDILLHHKKDNILKLLNLLKLANFEVNQFIEDYNFDEIDDIETFDGSIVYIKEGEDNNIIVSKQFKIANKIASDKIRIDGVEKNVIEDKNLKGVFGIISDKVEEYPFKRVKID